MLINTQGKISRNGSRSQSTFYADSWDTSYTQGVDLYPISDTSAFAAFDQNYLLSGGSTYRVDLLYEIDTGAFTSATAPGEGSSNLWAQTNGETPLELEVTATIISIEGDFNSDGRVDGEDESLVLANWGSSNPSPDFVATELIDGIIDQGELNDVLANFGYVYSHPNASYLPEPHLAGLFVIGLSSLCARIRRPIKHDFQV